MPILSTVPLTDKIPFEANTTKSIKIPRNRFIRAIQLRLLAKAVNGATPPTLHEDNPMSLVKRIRLIQNGKDTIFDAPMSLRWFEQKYLSGTDGERVQTSTTANATSTAIAETSIEFAVDELNEQDISALLPAAALTDLELFIDWGTNTDLATANPPTITAADTYVQVSLIEVELTDADIAELSRIFGEAKTMRKVVRTTEKSITETSSNFEFAKNLNVGSMIQRHLLEVIDNGVRDDTLVSRFKFSQSSPVKADLEDRVFNQSQAKDKRRYKLESVTKGITIVDWTEKGFLDLTELKEGDVKYHHNNGVHTGTAKIVLLQTEYT